MKRRGMMQRILVILLTLILIVTAIMPFLPITFAGQSLILPTAQAAQDTTTNGPNGDWAASKVTYYATDSNHSDIGAEMMVRYGDIDNFGGGWSGKDPFTGVEINAPYPTIKHESDDPAGTDQLMVIKTFIDYVKSGSLRNWTNDDSIADGYTRTYYSSNKALPGSVPIDMVYNLRNIQVKSAILQLYVNDFQPRKPKANGWNKYVTYTAYIDGVAAPFISNQINTLNQSGPLGQLLTFNIPTEYLSLLQDGRLSIKLDDDSTTKTPYGDGMAIDFVKVLINPGDYTNVGSISGKVTDTSGKAIAGATVSAMGMAVATTDANGAYQLTKVPYGLVVLEASASGYQTGRIEIPNFKSGYNQPANFVLTAQSNNADLENLVVSSGNLLPLSPSFNSDTTSYTIDLDSNLSSVLITPTTDDKGATLTVNGVAHTSGTAKEIPLSIGQTVVTIVVKAPNGTTKTYTVTIKTPQLSISRSLAKNTVKVNEEATITYVIEPKPLRADQVSGGGSTYQMNNIVYREDIPANVKVSALDSSWTATAANTASHIEVNLPVIRYQKSGDQYTAPKQTYTVKLKATQEGSYVLDNGQLDYPYLDGTRKTGKFDALVLYVEPAVASITLDQTELEMHVDDVYDRLKVTVLPANADQRVIWTSSDPSIVTVENGVLTAKAPGTVTITVTSADGTKSATCEVTVVDYDLNPTSSTLYAWGSDASGQLGDEKQQTVNSTKPLPVPAFAVKEATGIAAGANHSMAVTKDGAVYTWGRNNEGELGLGNTKTDWKLTNTPHRVVKIDGTNYTGVWAGGNHSFALNQLGRTYAWGSNQASELGFASGTGMETLPQLVYSLGSTVKFAAGTSHTAAFLNADRIDTAGANTVGQRGNPGFTGDNKFTQLYAAWQITQPAYEAYSGFTSFAAIAAGDNFTLALQKNGNVWGWGDNGRGQLTFANSSQVIPKQISQLSGVTAIAAGSTHSLAATASGKVYAWGDNQYGQLGNLASGAKVLTPVEIPALAGKNVVQLAAGDGFSVALTANGDVYTWGRNDAGQLGLGNTTRMSIPQKVPGLGGVQEIAAGNSHVLARGGTLSPVTGVTLDKTKVSVQVNDFVQLTATVQPPDAANKNVIWASADPTIATVDANGKITGVKVGTTTVTVTTEEGNFTATCEVEVKPAAIPVVKVTGVTLDQSTMTLNVGATGQLTETVAPDNATDKTVKWSTSNSSVATVNADGTVTAKAPGKATITVTTNDGNYTATCVVTVIQPVPVTGVKLDKTTMTINVGDNKQLTATVLPDNATDKSVVWSTSNSSIATVDANGNVTAKAPGKTTITVTTNDGHYQATCEVTVIQGVPVTGVELSPSAATVSIGESKQLAATVMPANATDKDVKWSSDHPEIATVDQNGLVQGIAVGKATITVRTEDGGYTDNCVITVVEGEMGFHVYLSESGGTPVRYQDVVFPVKVYVELQIPKGGDNRYWIDGQQGTYTGVRIPIDKEGTTAVSYFAKPSDTSKTTKYITIDKNPFDPANVVKITQNDGGSGDLTLSIGFKGTEMAKPDGVSYEIAKGGQQSKVGGGTMTNLGQDVYTANVQDALFGSDSKGFYVVTVTATKTITIYDEDDPNKVVHTETLTQSYQEGFMISPGFVLKAIEKADGVVLPSSRNPFISNKPITVTLEKETGRDSYFPAEVAKLSDIDKLKFGTLFDKNGDGVIQHDATDWDWGVVKIEYAIVPKGTNVTSDTFTGWKPLTTTQFVITTPNADWEIYIKTTDNATRWNSAPVVKYTKIQGTFRVNPANKKL